MDTSTVSPKLNFLNTIALYLIVAIVGGYLLFKPDNTLNKDTVEKLAVAVNGIATASTNMTKAANEQREWYTTLQRNAALNKQNRDDGYEDLYGKYGYSDTSNTLSLSDIYDRRMREQTTDLGGSNVRGVQNGTGQAGAVQKPAAQSQGQPN